MAEEPTPVHVHAGNLFAATSFAKQRLTNWSFRLRGDVNLSKGTRFLSFSLFASRYAMILANFCWQFPSSQRRTEATRTEAATKLEIDLGDDGR